MKLDLDELEKLAREATPGERKAVGDAVKLGRYGLCPSVTAAGAGNNLGSQHAAAMANAAFIASCSPDRILRLIEIARAANGAQGALGQASFALRELLPNDPDAQMTVAIVEKAAAALRAALEGVKK